MKLGLIALIVVGLLVVFGLVLGGSLIGSRNDLVQEREAIKGASAQVDNVLQRRNDLIPNLVETVKGYASHEKGTLEGVIAARNRAMTSEGPAAKAETEGALTAALRQVFALAEAYPQLRAVESFNQLQATLNQIEDSVQNARRYYNAVVRDLNTKILQFPTNIFAGMLGFKQREFFEVTAAVEREAPKVSFSTPGAPTA